MIQFILDNNEFIIYVFMALSFIFLVRTYYQYDRDGNMFTPVVAFFCSLFIFFFLVFATGANYPVSGGPWKQIYQNNVDATIELSYTDEGKKQTIVTGKSPVDLETLQGVASNYIFLKIELKAKSGDNTLFKRVGITQDNIKAKNVDPNNAKIAKIEYRPIIIELKKSKDSRPPLTRPLTNEENECRKEIIEGLVDIAARDVDLLMSNSFALFATLSEQDPEGSMQLFAKLKEQNYSEEKLLLKFLNGIDVDTLDADRYKANFNRAFELFRRIISKSPTKTERSVRKEFYDYFE